MKLIYKPFGVLFGVLASVISRRLFKVTWSLLDERDPPTPTTAQTTWVKLLSASAIQALTFSLTRATVNRLGAKMFARLTGYWPGERRHEPR
jgi:Protein of unknown function (DUF4235)